MEKDKSISPAEFNLIASQVQDDEADPDEVRELLESICDRIDLELPRYNSYHFGRPVGLPPVALRYIRDSLRRYLNESRRSLDRSFGVKKKPGKPKADRGPRIDMATEFLRLRLKRRSHEFARVAVGKKFSKRRTVVDEAWAAHKFEAYINLRVDRQERKRPLAEWEIQRLYKLLKKESWVISPG